MDRQREIGDWICKTVEQKQKSIITVDEATNNHHKWTKKTMAYFGNHGQRIIKHVVTFVYSEWWQSRKNLPKWLSYKVADYTPIVNIHTRSISVENSSNSYFCCKMHRYHECISGILWTTWTISKELQITNPMLPVVVKHQCLCHTLPLIITASNS